MIQPPQLPDVKDNMKQKAATTLDKPNPIFTFAHTQLPDDGRALLPSVDTCKCVPRRICVQHHPHGPWSLQELSIVGSWTMTASENPVRFLPYESGIDSDERVVLFAAEDHLEKLANAETWSMGGNFVNSYHFHAAVCDLGQGVREFCSSGICASPEKGPRPVTKQCFMF